MAGFRSRRLAELWTWLPAFRAVAETEHLPTASALLHVGPPALSRSIRLLEEQLGVSLFDREGRKLRLNSAGEALLSHLRDAMRLLDEGVNAAQGAVAGGPLYVSSTGPFTEALVLPALVSLSEGLPGVVPELSGSPVEEIHGRLLRGQLDVAFHSQPVEHPELRLERLGAAPCGVYCGAGHPLFEAGPQTLAALTEHDFVAPLRRQGHPSTDHWPTHLPRRVTLRAAQLHLGVAATRGGALLGVFPALAVTAAVAAGELREVRLEGDVVLESAALYASRRPALPGAAPGLADRLVASVRAQFEEAVA